jgi:hypothetical protein
MPLVEHPFDRQQQKLYDAQIEAFRGTPLHAALSTSECLGFNKTIFTRATVAGYWKGKGIPALTVVPSLGLNAGMATWYRDSYEDARIELEPGGKRGWIVAHEAAHIILMAGRPEHVAFEIHGKEYAAVFIWAVSSLFGKKWSNRLKRAFAEARIESVCKLTED